MECGRRRAGGTGENILVFPGAYLCRLAALGSLRAFITSVESKLSGA